MGQLKVKWCESKASIQVLCIHVSSFKINVDVLLRWACCNVHMCSASDQSGIRCGPASKVNSDWFLSSRIWSWPHQNAQAKANVDAIVVHVFSAKTGENTPVDRLWSLPNRHWILLICQHVVGKVELWIKGNDPSELHVLLLLLLLADKKWVQFRGN